MRYIGTNLDKVVMKFGNYLAMRLKMLQTNQLLWTQWDESNAKIVALAGFVKWFDRF